MPSEVGKSKRRRRGEQFSKVLSFEILFDAGLIDPGLFFVISLAFIRFIYLFIYFKG